MKTKRFRIDFRTSHWQPALLSGLWVTAALVILLIILDWAWALFQFFFPARFEKIRSPALSKMTETKTIAYDDLKASLTARNLFSKKLPKAETAVQTNLDSELARFKLIGVLSGKNKRAVFRDKNNPQSLFVGEGGMAGNVKIKQIREKSVVAALGGEEKELFVEK